uniref:Uncharacterized protein n=1 Tax=viral metagenome TaxID=1070528 RepID=A0A6C0K9P2_9ZZZZ
MDFADTVNFVVRYEKVVKSLPSTRKGAGVVPRLGRSWMTRDLRNRARMMSARKDLVDRRRRARAIDAIRKVSVEWSSPDMFNILPDDCILYHCDDLDDCEKIRTDLAGIPLVPDHQVVHVFADILREIREFIDSCDSDAMNIHSQMDETDEVNMLFCDIKL